MTRDIANYLFLRYFGMREFCDHQAPQPEEVTATTKVNPLRLSGWWIVATRCRLGRGGFSAPSPDPFFHCVQLRTRLLTSPLLIGRLLNIQRKAVDKRPFLSHWNLAAGMGYMLPTSPTPRLLVVVGQGYDLLASNHVVHAPHTPSSRFLCWDST